MAHWGIAMTLFQPLWPTRPRPEALLRGWEAVQKAKALEPRTERERLFVAAAAAFFLEPASSDYWLRIRRWEQASEMVYASFPGDPETGAFYALALLATAPSDTISRAHSDQAAEILLRLYERNPDHPGAMHYLVHANDVPGRERESLEITIKYEAVAPRNPHALHMPTHIYTRLGDWNGVIRGNLPAAESALEHPAGEHGELVWDEFPHAIEYLVYAYLQEGADEKAAAELKRLRTTAPLIPGFVLLAVAGTLPPAAAAEPAQPGAKPNILVIFGDDIGVTNVSAYSDGLMGTKRPTSTASARRASGSCTTTRSSRAPPAARRSSPASTGSAPASPRWASPARRWA
jgi:hypothetical protein